MDKLSELTVSAIKGWEKLVVFSGLGFFSIYITGTLFSFKEYGLIKYNNLDLIIFLSLLVFTLSYVVYRYFPEKFPLWKTKWIGKILKEPVSGRAAEGKIITIILMILFLSPLAIFFKSVGLAFFILSLLNSDIAFFMGSDFFQ